MKYFEPARLDEALSLLATEQDARCLAGGQTLVAIINLGAAEFGSLIALRGIPGLQHIQADSGGVTVGAMATHAAIARDARLNGRFALLREAASKIAHPAIRSQGTIGGSICHADPAADYPAVMVALDGEISIASTRGTRTLSARDFFVGFLTTALEPDELVTKIHFRRPTASGSARGVYEKFARVDGDFATVSVACAISMDEGVCTEAAIALGSCDVKPVQCAEAEAHLLGSRLDARAIAEAGTLLAQAAKPLGDVRGSAEYRRRLIPGLVARAVERARIESEAQ